MDITTVRNRLIEWMEEKGEVILEKDVDGFIVAGATDAPIFHPVFIWPTWVDLNTGIEGERFTHEAFEKAVMKYVKKGMNARIRADEAVVFIGDNGALLKMYCNISGRTKNDVRLQLCLQRLATSANEEGLTQEEVFQILEDFEYDPGEKCLGYNHEDGDE